jgi:hypothetical protein
MSIKHISQEREKIRVHEPQSQLFSKKKFSCFALNRPKWTLFRTKNSNFEGLFTVQSEMILSDFDFNGLSQNQITNQIVIFRNNLENRKIIQI